MNKPVAWMLVDEINGDYMLERHPSGDYDWIPLYTHPVKELNDGGEPVKNATYWKRQYNLMATQNDNLKSGLYHANEQIKYLEGQLDIRTRELIGASFYEHDYKTLMAKPPLTDEEIHKEFLELVKECDPMLSIASVGFPDLIADFAKAILRKAQEK